MKREGEREGRERGEGETNHVTHKSCSFLSTMHVGSTALAEATRPFKGGYEDERREVKRRYYFFLYFFELFLFFILLLIICFVYFLA